MNEYHQVSHIWSVEHHKCLFFWSDTWMVAVSSNLLSSYYTANLPVSLFSPTVSLLKNLWKKSHFLASASRAFLLLMQPFSVLPFFSAPFFLWHMSTLFSRHRGAAHAHMVTGVRVGAKHRTHCGIKSPCSFQVRKHRCRQTPGPGTGRLIGSRCQSNGRNGRCSKRSAHSRARQHKLTLGISGAEASSSPGNLNPSFGPPWSRLNICSSVLGDMCEPHWSRGWRGWKSGKGRLSRNWCWLGLGWSPQVLHAHRGLWDSFSFHGSATASTGAASASAGVAVDLDLEMPLAPLEAVSASESNSRHRLRGSLTLKASFRCGFKCSPSTRIRALAAEIRGSAHKFSEYSTIAIRGLFSSLSQGIALATHTHLGFVASVSPPLNKLSNGKINTFKGSATKGYFAVQ